VHRTGFHLWSESYDRELKDIFAVQEDIAIKVANELKMTLGIGKPLKNLGGTGNLDSLCILLRLVTMKGQMKLSRQLDK
jgi:hypothetical protein